MARERFPTITPRFGKRSIHPKGEQGGLNLRPSATYEKAAELRINVQVMVEGEADKGLSFLTATDPMATSVA